VYTGAFGGGTYSEVDGDDGAVVCGGATGSCTGADVDVAGNIDVGVVVATTVVAGASGCDSDAGNARNDTTDGGASCVPSALTSSETNA
jgi:hypothetical protein